MVNLSLNELKLIAKNKGYKSKFKAELTKILSKLELKINSLKLRKRSERNLMN